MDIIWGPVRIAHRAVSRQPRLRGITVGTVDALATIVPDMAGEDRVLSASFGLPDGRPVEVTRANDGGTRWTATVDGKQLPGEWPGIHEAVRAALEV